MQDEVEDSLSPSGQSPQVSRVVVQDSLEPPKKTHAKAETKTANYKTTTLNAYSDEKSSTVPRNEGKPENTKEVLLTEGFAEIENKNGKLILTVTNNNETYKQTLNLSTLLGILNVGGSKIDKTAIHSLQKAGIVIINIHRDKNNEIWELKVGGPLQRRFGKYTSWWDLEHTQHFFLDSRLKLPFCKCLVMGKIESIRNLGQMDISTFRDLIEKLKGVQTLEEVRDIISVEGSVTEYQMLDFYLRTALKAIGVEFKERIRFGDKKDKNKDQDVVNYLLDYLMVCLRYHMVVLLAHANITPYISFLHKIGDLFHMGLASDLMTPFEPYMARLAFELMRDGISMYTEVTIRENRKIYQLNAEGRKKLYEAFIIFITTYHEDMNINPYTGTILDQMYNIVHRFKNILMSLKNKNKK